MSRFAIHAQHLMRMPVLCTPHESDLARRRTIVVEDKCRAIDTDTRQLLRDHAPIGIIPDDTRQCHFGVKTSQHVGHVGGPTQSRFLLVFSQQDHRGFLADPLGITPDVTVQYQIPDHQDPRGPKLFDIINQFVRHRVRRPWPATGG